MTGRAGSPKIIGVSTSVASIPRISLMRKSRRSSNDASLSTGQIETRPCFTSSWITPPDTLGSEVVSTYSVMGVDVTIAAQQGSSSGAYLLNPPEYRLNPNHLQALSEAMEQIVDAIPEDFEVQSLAAMRPYIKTRAKDLLYTRLASRNEGGRNGKELDKDTEYLAEILCKYTAGFGVLETLLEDRNIQDVYVDSPSSQTPVQVVLRSDVAAGVRQKCRTNIFVGKRDLQGFVSRIKFETGLPFSEAHPVLEADIRRLGARVTLVSPPLSDRGTSIAIRKHSEGVWPMNVLISKGCLSPLLASFLWACVMGRRTVLIAGSRGAGKTTLLSSLMLEFPLSQRMILIEDTPEVPFRRLQDLGFDIQALRFSDSAERKTSSAENSLRVSLRMGESAIVIGEVRGEEARVLYESMRAGSAGSAVLGTIHANSAKGVLDRAVEDLRVSERAFSSTDVIVVIGLIRSPDGARFDRRIVEVAEVRAVGSGVELAPLFVMMPGCSCAKPTDAFSPRCKTLAGIAGALGRTPEEIMDIVKARAHADQILADALSAELQPGIAGTDGFRVKSNEYLAGHLFGDLGPEAGLRDWKGWYDANRSISS